MSLLQVEPDRNVHPVDIIEHIASINDWTFERQDADEAILGHRAARLAARLTGWRIDIRSDEAPAEPAVTEAPTAPGEA